jgi:hypothetical protein
MKINYKITLAVIGSFVLGAGAASVLHAQGHVPTGRDGQRQGSGRIHQAIFA